MERQKDYWDFRAQDIVKAICELMAAHEAVWRHGAPRDSWDASRQNAENLIAEALRSAGAAVVHLEYD